MKFIPTSFSEVWLIELDPRADNRGFLARTYCEREFGDRGLNTRWPQCNLTRTLKRGVVRGMHWQAAPKPEIKLVRCAVGAIWDVVVDVRRGSPSFGRWEGFELTSENFRELYVPAGFAHGFQVLKEASEVFYQMGEFYEASLARGVRWNDPALGISWPLESVETSDRDAQLPLLEEVR
ncbi:MAG TPA: dTDP-4-dehydrorhamnose 3,5-epimerase [Candidatus Limnocylindria bacterium]|jgi:dTDP-4-dehydrorhamnose 3,5-epimerase|nr:dTDP-4-dehydrorhamnose 3,5-epimerase [Candidatus Limnocylindria bacterium]